MIIITKTEVRTSTDVEFFTPSTSSLSHIDDNYSSRRKLRVDVTISDDGLTKVTNIIHADQDCLDELSSDPIVQVNLDEQVAYNDANGIKVSYTRKDYP